MTPVTVPPPVAATAHVGVVRSSAVTEWMRMLRHQLGSPFGTRRRRTGR